MEGMEQAIENVEDDPWKIIRCRIISFLEFFYMGEWEYLNYEKKEFKKERAIDFYFRFYFLHFLEDLNLLDNANDLLGEVFKNEEEVKAITCLMELMDNIYEEVKDDSNNNYYLSCSKWPLFIKNCKSTILLMK